MTRDLWRSSAERRTWIRSFAYWAPIAALTIWTHGELYGGSVRLSNLSHAQRSMDTAVAAAYCGKPGMASSRYSIYKFLTERGDLMAQPFRNVMAAQAESVSNYCASVNVPIVVEENSLHWLERLAIWSNVRITPAGLAWSLGGLRLLMIGVFGLALLRAGSSILFVAAAVMLAADVAEGLRDTAYPFAMVVPLLYAGLYGIAAAGRPARAGGPWLWAFALGMGALTAFSAALRTNQLPVGAAMFVLFLASVYFCERRPRTAGALRSVAAPIAAFAVGYGAYVLTFVAPLRNPGVSNYSYHTFAHPLVLGLGVPENDLSRREGIEWLDERGDALAKQVSPDAVYLGPTYEAALMRYWFGLWRRYPRDMAATYFVKLRSTGTGVFLAAGSVAARYGIPCAVFEAIERWSNGIVLAVLGLAAFVAASVGRLRTGSSRLLIVALVSAAALLTLAEGFLTYSRFVGHYFSYLLYFVIFLAFVAAQAAADALAGIRTMSQGAPA